METSDPSNILERLLKHLPKESQARSAFHCYNTIRSVGYDQAKASYPKTSWYRHLSNLKSIGLSRADLVQINIIPIQKSESSPD